MKNEFPAVCGAIAALLSSAFAGEPPPPPGLAAALIEAAAKTGDAGQIAAVANAAKEVFPDNAAAIEAFAATKIAATAPPDALTVAEAETEAPADKPDGWTGKVATSAALANGNSENMAVGLLLDARREAGRIAHNLDGYVDFGRSNGVQNLKRWGAAYQLDYQFSERAYAYGRISYDEDQFSGFDYRLFGGTGVGYFIRKSEAFTWKIEGGPGYQYSPIDDTRAVQKEIAIYAGTELDWIIREGLKFEQDVKAVWTDPTTTFVSLTGLSAALAEQLAAGVAYEFRYETNPPLGRKNTDTVLRANISLGF